MPDLTSTVSPLHVDHATRTASLGKTAEMLSSSLDGTHDALSPEDRAVDIILRTAAEIPANETAISFNGGKDAVVMLELLLRTLGLEWVKGCFMFVLINTEGEFPELVEFRKQYVASCLPGAVLHEINAGDSMKQGLWRATEEHHFSAVFMGTRKDDPSGKYQQIPWKLTTADWPPMIRVCPILSWCFKDVWAYTIENRIPFCKLYLDGYTSLGDCKATSPNARLQKEDGSFAPAWMLAADAEERAGRMDSSI